MGSFCNATFQIVLCIVFMGKPAPLNDFKIILCSLMLEFPIGGKYRSVCLNRREFEVDLMLG